MSTEKPVIIKDPQGKQKGEIQFSDQEEARDLKRNSQGQIGSVEDLKGNKLAEEETSKANWSNLLDVGKELGRAVSNALTAHGDEISNIKLRDIHPDSITVRVYYKPSEETPESFDGDDFVFNFKDGKVQLNVGEGKVVDVCPLEQQSGTLKIQKDLVQDAVQKFLKDNTVVKEGEEDLWECDGAKQQFLEAVNNFRTNGKSKETVKELLRCARSFKKGNSIQEKLKEAAGWYNIYSEEPPQNTKEQVFLENEETFDVWKDVFDPINKGLDNLKDYINKTEDTWIGSYYRELRSQMDKLQWFYQTHADRFGDEPEPLDENNPVDEEFKVKDAGLKPAPEDGEGDETPEGKTIMIGDNTYKFVEYFGYKALVQNVDDDRDFQLVDPELLK